VLLLRIVSGQTPRISPAAAGDSPIEVWRDLDGGVCALGEYRGQTRSLRLPGLASFEFDTASDEVRAYAEPGVDHARIVDQYRRTVLPFAFQTRGYESLHASAVRTPGGVVALCAVKESGKSTLAFALARRGYPLWADDAVVVEVGAATVSALAVPFEIRLRPASAAHFGWRARDDGAPAPSDVAEPISLARAPLAALFVLERIRGARGPAHVELRRLERAEAFTAVLTHAYCFTLDHAERKALMMRQYLGLVARVPIYALRYPSGLDQLPGILAAIEGVIQPHGAELP
jgi:hypothetical protein